MKDRLTDQLKHLYASIRDGSIWHHPVLRFVLIGGFNTLHFALWYNLFLWLDVRYSLAFTLAFVIANITSFFLNTYFTFRTKPTLKKFLSFPLTALPNYLISQAGLWLLVERFGIMEEASGILASLLAIPVTYLLTKYILTSDRGKGVQTGRERLEGPVVTKYDSAYQLDALERGKGMKWLRTRDLFLLLGFILFSLFCHLYIFRSGFLYGDDHTDSTVQMIYFLPYLIKEVLLEGNFWGWSYGMGGDIFAEFSYYYTTSPVVWSLWPLFRVLPESWFTLENSLNLKLFISIYKQVWIMIVMYLLLRYEKRSRSSSFAAAIVYAGGIYYMWNANFFDFMTDAYIWFPLMVLGFRIWQRKRNFWPLVLAAAMAAINNYYFAFHSFIIFILFVLLMVKAPPQKGGLWPRMINWFKEVAQYAWQGITALLLSMFAFLPAAFAFLKLDRFDTVNPVSTFYGRDFYMNMPINLFFNNSTLGIPMLIMLFFFINYRRTSELTDRKVFLLMVFFILYMLPFTGYFLNGMNYHSERWFYLLLFVFGYVLADILDEMKKANHFNLFWLGLVLIITGLMIYLRWDIIAGFDDKVIYATVLAFNIFAFFAIAMRSKIPGVKLRKASDILVVVLIFGIMVGNNFAYANDQKLNMNTAKMQSEKMKSPELIDVMSRTVPTEDEFFRTVFHNNGFENAPTYYEYYGISTFASMTDGPMHDWIKRILNIRHDIVYLSSFNNLDNRAYLEGLLGVRYIVTEKETYEPVPPYEEVYSNARYTLWENTSTVGMDLWFEEELPVEEIYSMGKPDMDMNLLSYAVTEKDNGLTRGIPVQAEEIPLTDEVMEFRSVYYDGSRIEFDEGGTIRFHIPDPYPESQVYLHTYMRPENRLEFDQTVNDKRVFKSYETNPYVYYTNDWTFAMNGGEDVLEWDASDKAYEISDFYLRRVDLRNFDEVIDARNKYNMEDLHVSGNVVSGTIENGERGILVLNIPYNKGWSAWNNGKKLEIQRMNGFLSGVVLEPGIHELTFKFRSQGFLPGLIITLLTLGGLIGFDFWRRKYRPESLSGDLTVLAPIIPDEDTDYPRVPGPSLWDRLRTRYRPLAASDPGSSGIGGQDELGQPNTSEDTFPFSDQTYSLFDESPDDKDDEI